MVTLIELFDEHRQQWFTQMQDNGQPEVVSQRTVLLLDTLQLRYLEQNDLEPLRRRLVPFVMDTLKATVTILTAANQTEVWRRQPKAS
ncbi:MAG: hypothetical protein SVR94_19840, partial [Pseudomonadota bacterium]|nr:hypothetical protein [Pseudomonadota bacterium]